MRKTIFAQETPDAARDQRHQITDAIRRRISKLARMIEAPCKDGLAYIGFPRAHWTQIASTNPLERLNNEVTRRTNVVGIFPTDATAVRLVDALLLLAAVRTRA